METPLKSCLIKDINVSTFFQHQFHLLIQSYCYSFATLEFWSIVGHFQLFLFGVIPLSTSSDVPLHNFEVDPCFFQSSSSK